MPLFAPRSGGVSKAFTAADAVTKSVSLGTAVAIPLVVVLLLFIAFFAVCCCKKRREKKKAAKQERDESYDGLTANAGYERSSNGGRDRGREKGMGYVHHKEMAVDDWDSDDGMGDSWKMGRGEEVKKLELVYTPLSSQGSRR
jgi:hypothetical protein